jgi:5'-3' exonuclease
MGGTGMKVVVVDGDHCLHAALYTDTRDFSTKDGRPTGGIYGVLQSVRQVLQMFPAHRCVYVWDGGHSERRLKLCPGYKDRSESDPIKAKEKQEHRNRFVEQRSRLQEILPKLGVHQIRLVGREADDVIGVLANTEHDVVVVSEDKDMLQLVTETVRVYQPGKKRLITIENFKTEIGTIPELFLLRLAIYGDLIDNVRGIPQVGVTVTCRVLDICEVLWRSRPPEQRYRVGCVDGQLSEDWVTALKDVATAAQQLAIGDSRNRRRYNALYHNIATVVDNIYLVDLDCERFHADELLTIHTAVTEERLGQFHELTALEECGKLELVSLLSAWGHWKEPFLSLR